MDGLGMNRMRLGLECITELLKRLGDPQNSFRSIHIAGSDGKGSVCAMIYSILLDAGVGTGAYTSPHLIRFNERISVAGTDIGDDELEDLMHIVAPVVDEMHCEGKEVTFFEAATAIAFLHFSKKGVEYAVLETGLGGRLDATNAVMPSVTAITHISDEHSSILGDTIEKIAFEKAGIIKKGIPVITPNTGGALSVIENVASKMNAPVKKISSADIVISSFANGHATMVYGGHVYEIGIPGRCQAENAATAIECVRHILGKDVNDHIAEGLKNVKWRGRMEYFPEENIVIDVTHTAAGAETLVSDISELYGDVILMIGMFKDKSADRICQILSRTASKVIVTRPDSERAMPAEELAEIMRKYSDDVHKERNIKDALDSVRDGKYGNAGGKTVLITGSLYMAGEAISYLERTRSQ
jgi:dihydrofolate synthase/folylpolyglutamate synthase